MDNSSIIAPLKPVPMELLGSPTSRLQNRVHAAQRADGAKQKSELKKVAQEFEAIFIAQLLKVMRETIEESGLTEGGFGKSIYTELFDQEVSLSMARRGALGISDLLYKNLADKNPEPNAPQHIDPASKIRSPIVPAAPESALDDPEISDLQLPVHAPVSSGFGVRNDPFSHRERFHRGLDLSAPEGMKVVSALPGTVISARYESGYGNTVLVQHPGGIQTRYGHLGTIRVKVGDVVASEAVLGTVGNTGRSTGPHLHFEVIRMGIPVDPLGGTSSQVTSLKQRSDYLKRGG